MEITIRNRIVIDGQEEFIRETFEGDVKKLGNKIALYYKNAEEEKVLIKFDETELSMTRYADKPVTMRFHKELSTHTVYEGLGPLEILTDDFHMNEELKHVKLKYRLAQNTIPIGEYRMRIDWKIS
ncbi:DUF1934 domain-containing protein [Lactococcus formosensis]|jgi:uncharacterized beta-barrel protein YwiB (DUF1934 family)|uniref:DUF1934 domain-containing protein n=1 Tax=Lactococcus formosensis TaxID=1281486 RepID=A0A9X4NZA0_9LACT|nr:DUF1934 domain-containing protein [Lactococcus formosensis]NHI67740.1 DUF1934 domain-containing protein [Lactococcus garvieae]MCH1723551.1 DUF1934 domain-containing protein [Lactococcus formosensis]MCO7180307.1 DUF1934 domain-containing protein [Lactococcus formosensis]MDG6111362.1 DUF1934 domain-containing protein [Lactococcus formosensis]MDG6113621.1 DUF1934 domain-containing protein [Lactococcus formosensis]